MSCYPASEDPARKVKELESGLDELVQFQETMAAVNAYFAKNQTLDGCPHLSAKDIEKRKEAMASSWRPDPKPYEGCVLYNNDAYIRQLKARIEGSLRQSEKVYVGWEIEGGEVRADVETGQLQVFFDSRPDQETCAALQDSGFQWVPHGAPAKPSPGFCGERERDGTGGQSGEYEARDKAGAWQRRLDDAAIQAADQLKCLRSSLFGELPSQIQKTAVWLQDRSHKAAAETYDWAGYQQLCPEERMAVDFCALLRERIPDAVCSGPDEAEKIEKLVRMLHQDRKRTTNEMVLAVSGFVTGVELPHSTKMKAENLMIRLARCRDQTKDRPAGERSQER